MQDDELREIVRRALHEAGLAGLCADGRRELARDRLAAAAPELGDGRRESLIAEVLAQAAPP